MSLISTGFVLGSIFLFAVSKKIHYIVGGALLMGIGVFGYLFHIGSSALDIYAYPAINFAGYITIIFASRDLLHEGVKESESALKWPSILLSIVLVTLTTIPTMNAFGVTEFTINLPSIVEALMYMISGIFLLIGTFTLLATDD